MKRTRLPVQGTAASYFAACTALSLPSQLGFDRFFASDYSPARNDEPKDRLGKLSVDPNEGHPTPQGKDGRVNSSPRVLVIDGSSDTETVLKAVLEPRGTSVERRRNRHFAPQFDASSSPEVVVIDLDADPDALQTASPWQNSPRVLLGSLRPAVAVDGERFLSKPFQYPELVRLIEELLDERAAA